MTDRDDDTSPVECDCDVAVVGCGPVGALTAILLAQAGHRVLVLERYAAPYPRPRAVVFDDEVARLFAWAGIPGAVANSVAAHEYVWQNAAGQTLLRFDYPPIGDSGWPSANMFDQPSLERLLIDRMAQLSTITVRRGEEVTMIEQTPDLVELSTQATDNCTSRWRARYAVGCDGANSLVRGQMNTAVDDLGFFFDWLIVDVILNEPRVFEPNNLQICDPRRPTTAVCAGPGRRRWEFMRMPGESIEDLNTEEMAWRLLRPWDVTPDDARLERHVVYTFQARWATDWRDKRLLLAGDAAHLMPPFAGQGMGSGLRDAANLAWKLDLVLSGRTTDALLNTYTAERSSHVQHAIGVSVALGSVICATDPATVAKRDAAMLAGGGNPDVVLPPIPPATLRDGLLQRTKDGAPAPSAGELILQARIKSGDVIGRFDEIVGNGFVILAIGDVRGVLRQSQLDVLAALDAHLVTVIPAEAHPPKNDAVTVVDIDNRYLPYLESVSAEAVVVRPDFYGFGSAATLAGLPDVVDDLIGQLGLTPLNDVEALDRAAS
jgi:2-polyprenyl-6-methoxyphenol hydroxylase-like FAD-dependent oxidoreductase